MQINQLIKRQIETEQSSIS